MANKPAQAATLGDMLNPIDRMVAAIWPAAGLRRIQQRHALAQVSKVQARAHESSAPGRMRKFFYDRLGPNGIVSEGAVAIRAQVRHMARNNDIARGILRTMVNNTIGPGGVGIDPQPRRADGSIHEEYAAQLREQYALWCRRPEVTRRMTMSKVQRSLAWAWLRDGESFSQDLIGSVPGLKHSTAVPYSLELFEADLVPLDYNEGDTIRQGIERNAWGEVLRYWVFKRHPLDNFGTLLTTRADLKAVDAARVAHLAFLDHIGQVRGISEFASIIARLEDIRDYEDSERIAAKVAAALTAYVKKTPGAEGYEPPETDPETGKPAPRDLRMAPGMIIDGLAIGEEIGLIDSSRPNPNVVTFRQGQLRAAAAGIGASYSSISKSYDGTFSSQRQELVEQWINYATLADEFVGQWLQPTWETLVNVLHLSGVARIPSDVKPGTADDAMFTAQAMPWIDPMKEAAAWVMLARAGFASEIEVLRKRGVHPADFLAQVSTWRTKTKAAGLVFTSDAANNVPVEPSADGAQAGNAGGPGEGAQGEGNDPQARATQLLMAEIMGRMQAQQSTPAPVAAAPHISVPVSISTPDIDAAMVRAADRLMQGMADMPVNVQVNVPQAAAPDVHVSVNVPQAAAPDVHVHAEVAAPDVHLAVNGPKASKQTVVRDANGEIVETTTTHSY